MILCSLKGLVLMVLIREKVENIVVFVRGNFQIKKVWKQKEVVVYQMF